jgi:predicted Rossmann fold flavoprotein
MKIFSTVIIGGGASGIIAAINTKRRYNNNVLICERLPVLGKKILATGGGRCNLLNEDLNEIFYNSNARGFVKTIFLKFGKAAIKGFFEELGLVVYSEKGRIFPVTNQAGTVLEVLKEELKKLDIETAVNFEIADIVHAGDRFILKPRVGKEIYSESVIITAGGKAYPSLGANGSGYLLAEKLGHKIIEPIPSVVPLVVKDKICHILQGQKIFAKTKALINGNVVSEAEGDVLFTKYGLSGTSILDISKEVSIGINRHKKEVSVAVDMVPFMDQNELNAELERRILKNKSAEKILTGILPNKFQNVIKYLCKGDNIEELAGNLKNKLFNVSGTMGWNEAEFTCGRSEERRVGKECDR